MNLQDLLDDEQRREERRQERSTPRHRIALVVGAVGAVIAIGTGAALTAAAVSEISGDGQQTAASTAAPDVSAAAPPDAAMVPTPPTIDPGPSATPSPASAVVEDAVAPEPGGITTILGYTVYDETSDLDLIPRPSAEFLEEWPFDVEVGLMQDHLDAVCMAEKGFRAAFIPMWQTWETGDTMAVINELDAFNDARTPEWREAMYGADDQPLGNAYDWQQAGCHGAAVHATGMDDAH
ncbi:hypothetical protein BCL57_000225 [Agromyces flavus]|uniref:Uncharacterized protein n=1 Tax=Agromyces flavus TaxID=589382 RepID=A0A1H1W3U7_9MICO|nr:hypothetical protein [Agromyces flavus]MCP2366083.1 hypothetical protein [Agromyces flavus]GGI43969.1 hypothetical protein GCM10010932_02250 [Agromyces flavus]SDS91807.1 hypothetical protein SAMN04489721_2154 [Agromyces flavus]